MKKQLFIFLLLVFFSFLQAEEKGKKLFLPKNVDLRVVSYPWANELSLSLLIYADPFVKNTNIKISISYGGKEVKTINAWVEEVTEERKYMIKKQFEPLNGPAQEVLSGTYSVSVRLIAAQQSPEFIQKWKKYSPDSHYIIAEKVFSIGDSQKQKQEEEKIKAFYIERMKALNGLFSKLHKTKIVAANAKKSSSNPFNENGEFSKRKWWGWFNIEFLEAIQKEKKHLEIHRKRVFALKYPYTIAGMEKYCELLIRIGRRAALDLYQFHKLKKDRMLMRGVDLFAIQNLRDLGTLIETIHVKSAAELGISLRKELGYIPPPK